MAYLEAMGIDVWLHRAVGGAAAPAEALSGTVARTTKNQDAGVAVTGKETLVGTGQAASVSPNAEPVGQPSEPDSADIIQDTDDAVVAKKLIASEIVDRGATPRDTAQQPPSTADLPATAPMAEKGVEQARVMPVSPPDTTEEIPTLATLQSQAIACTRCELHSSRLQSVFGDGNADADWMFVGEAPGAEEDRQGLPFVGPAGQLLNAMLIAIGLQREQVYIANLVKCRPPRNRDPRPEELSSCQGFINAQLAIVKPKIIVALGRFAAQSLIGSTESIGRLRTASHTHAATGTKIVATYHPAYLLRSPVEKSKSWQDLLRARDIVLNGDHG